METITQDQILQIAERLLKDSHPDAMPLDTYPEYIQVHWIDEAYAAIEHFRIVRTVLKT